MPLAKKIDACSEHLIHITELKKDVEHLKEHNNTINETIKTGFIELNEKVRKLEDRKVISMFVEKFIWLAIGVFITVLIEKNYSNYIAIREKSEYKIVKDSTKKGK